MGSCTFREHNFYILPMILVFSACIGINAFFLAPPGAAANTPTGSFQIQFEQEKVFFHADAAPLSEILNDLNREFQIQITGLDDRSAERISYTTRADSFHEMIKGLMRHLGVKNFALEYTGGQPSRVSVFPEARSRASAESAASEPGITQGEPRIPGEAINAVEVLSIVDASQAQAMGLQKGDIILEYGGRKMDRASALVKESKAKSSDEEIEMVVLREGEPLRFTVKGGFIGVRIKTVALPAEPGGTQ